MPRRAASAEPADRRATIRDVAKAAGVSIATVSRVLGGTYPTAAATRTRVMRAVRDLDYVVNSHARALAGISTKSVAIVVSSVVSPFYAHVAQAVETQAAQEGRLCLISTTGGDLRRELGALKLMLEEHAEAVILIGNVVDNDEYRRRVGEYARALAAAGSQLVLCGRPAPGPDVPAIVVDYDNTGGARAATGHLLSAGHRRILYLGHKPGYTTSEGRIAGYREALAAHGVPEDPGLVLAGGALERQEGYRLMRERLRAAEPDFTAVFAANDQLAAGGRQALHEHGLRIPEDISLMGYDDLPPATDIGLTTTHVPHDELGRTAVRLALQRDRAGGADDHVVLGTHVVVRQSVRPLTG
ncbi:LacI family DNA-binding transcriptional regulator [Dactylosporangium aurantiacum]|uniref:LacI family DNA-binding transcriptional regulator n=1 Tax=Dactylosporangium aurantiacum TaxID=35754 RepID=A0A9Q9ITN4_9ACTN|nr:LacI family DNA-binding transcriptional regulator [Dactylosporangium aurantiacum]